MISDLQKDEAVNFLRNKYKNTKLWGPVSYDRTDVSIPKRLSDKELLLESFYLTNDSELLCEIRIWENTCYITHSLILSFYNKFGPNYKDDFIFIFNHWITSKFEIGHVEYHFVLPDEDFLQIKKTIFTHI